ncbi:phBC6A51 family helix-turn-helix protein [Cytobacillus firmus]|uniref:phBC6A51 family helix-turn-helix protein n=1 Tax=Cytobacillus firmus TaxID=1399 RepID=UPI0036A4D4BC
MDIFEGMNETEIKVVKELVNKGNRTYDELAEAIGISERHLFRYRQKPHIKKAVRELAIQELEEEVPTMMKALKKNIAKGDYRSIELGFKALGLLVERREVNQTTTIEDNRYQNMTEDDIDAELAEIENELKVIQGGAK